MILRMGPQWRRNNRLRGIWIFRERPSVDLEALEYRGLSKGFRIVSLRTEFLIGGGQYVQNQGRGLNRRVGSLARELRK
jgi:hypothetical protein